MKLISVRMINIVGACERAAVPDHEEVPLALGGISTPHFYGAALADEVAAPTSAAAALRELLPLRPGSRRPGRSRRRPTHGASFERCRVGVEDDDARGGSSPAGTGSRSVPEPAGTDDGARRPRVEQRQRLLDLRGRR